MVEQLKFGSKSIREAEDYYKNLHIDPSQKDIVMAMTKLFSQALPIPERALKGFMWRNIREWQIQHHKDLSEIARGTLEERMNTAHEIFALFGEALRKILIDKEQEPILEEYMKKGLELYKEKFAKR